jgi:predicted Zn finger-like uncharacterized protein
MHIVCPHCTTSYAVDPVNFSAAGRRVRCVRCHEIWLAVPQDMATAATSPGYDAGEAGPGTGSDSYGAASDTWRDDDAPHIESPSISSDGAAFTASSDHEQSETTAHDEAETPGTLRRGFAAGRALPRRLGARTLNPSGWRRALPAAFNLPTVCMALGTLAFALIVWRADVVRAMPQTAAFFKMTGFDVNLRGLRFDDVKVSTEVVDNKPVLLIEGALVDVARRSMEIPRLRFIVRDAKGNDIYAWNAVLEQSVINPGENVQFKTRLASPPPEGREIAVRFFHKLDIAAGGS